MPYSSSSSDLGPKNKNKNKNIGPVIDKPKSALTDDGPEWRLGVTLMSLFIVCIFLGACCHPTPRTDIFPNSVYQSDYTKPLLLSNAIPSDLRICRDTNGPIDWRTWGK